MVRYAKSRLCNVITEESACAFPVNDADCGTLRRASFLIPNNKHMRRYVD